MNWALVFEAPVAGAWWAFIPAAISIAIITFSLYMMNTGMDEIFNPKIRADGCCEHKYTGSERIEDLLPYPVEGACLCRRRGELLARKGKTLGIAGESGRGKSTLALSLMGFYFPPPHYGGGSIVVSGTDIMKLGKEQLRSQVSGREISYIPQATMNALNPTLKIIHFVEDIMKEHRPELNKKQVWDMAAERFETLNLSTKVLNSYPNELSGGMKRGR